MGCQGAKGCGLGSHCGTVGGGDPKVHLPLRCGYSPTSLLFVHATRHTWAKVSQHFAPASTDSLFVFNYHAINDSTKLSPEVHSIDPK